MRCEGRGRQGAVRVRRRGTIVVFAMIALLVASMIAASLVKSAVMSLRQLQRQQLQFQASCLADSGCQRALSRLRHDSEYAQEDWTIPATELKSGPAVVRIQIGLDPDHATQRLVTVAAEYPQGAVDAIRITRKIVIPAGPSAVDAAL